MKITLILKKKWFDLIRSGQKTKEFREFKPYWFQRFIETKECKKISEIDAQTFIDVYKLNIEDFVTKAFTKYKKDYWHSFNVFLKDFDLKFKDITEIEFVNGYRKDAERFIKQVEKIEVRKPKEDEYDIVENINKIYFVFYLK